MAPKGTHGRTVERSVVPNFAPDFFRFMGVKLRDDPFEQPYTMHPWIHTCVNLRATSIAQVPWVIYKQGPEKPSQTMDERVVNVLKEAPMLSRDKAMSVSRHRTARERFFALQRFAPFLNPESMLRAIGDAAIVEDGQWVDLFRDVNPHFTRSQLWEASYINLNAEHGECFWVLEGAGNVIEETEIPREIWPMSAHGWKPNLNKSTGLPTSWTYTRRRSDGTEDKKTFAPQQLVRWRRYNPYDGIRGTSPFDALKRLLELDHLATLFNLAFFKGGAQIGGVVSFERPLTPQQRTDFIEMLEGRHVGARKANRWAVAEGGVKFEESKQNHKNMQHKELVEWIRDAVFTAYRTPKALAGMGSYDTKATANAETKNFWETVLLPDVQYGEDLLASDLFTMKRTKGVRMWGAFDLSTVEALREDLNEKLDAALKFQTAGYTINQVNERLQLGMDPVPWGNIWYPPNTVQSLDTMMAPPPDPAAAPPKPGAPGQPKPPKPPEGKNAEETRAAERTAYWHATIERVWRPSEELYGKRLRGFLFDLRNHQLHILKQRGRLPAEALAFEEREWRAQLKKRTEVAYAKTFDASYAHAMEEAETLQKSLDRVNVNDPERDAIIDQLSTRVGRVVRTVRSLLVEKIQQVLDAGGDEDAIAAAVRELFSRVSSRGMALRVTRTEVGFGISEARRVVTVRADIVKHDWVTAEDEKVRHTHEVYGLAGAQSVGFNYATLTGGAYTLERPCDPRAPAGEVIHCRCGDIFLG